MNKEKLKAEARKVELALKLAVKNGGIDRSLSYDIRYLIECINKLDESELKGVNRKIDKLEEYNGVLIIENNQLMNTLYD